MRTLTSTKIKLLPILFIVLAAGAIVLVDESDASSSGTVHTVDLRVNGGTGVDQQWLVRDGDSLELPTQIFSRSGFILSGWAVGSPTGPIVKGAMEIDRDIILYASWEATPTSDSRTYHDVKAPVNASVGSPYRYVPIQDNSASDDCWQVFLSSEHGWAVESKPDWMNVTWSNRTFEFSGQPTDSGNAVVKIRIDTAGSPAYIYWTVGVGSSSDEVGTISFDTAGGAETVPSIKGHLGTAVVLPDSSSTHRVGFSLAGWDVSVTEGDGMFALGSYFILDGDYVAKAHWLGDANVVIFDGSGMIGNQIDAFVGYNNETITLPSDGYLKQGCSFEGWRLTSSPNEIYAPGFIYTISGPTYMSAYYVDSQAITSEVLFDANGGNGTLSVNVEPGRSVVLPDKGFTNTTTLEGWVSSVDGMTYLPGDSVEVGGDTTFSAVWSEDIPEIVTVSFDLAGGSGSSATQILENGALASRPEDPVRSAHIFNGWFEVGGGPFDFSGPITHSITLRADWIQHFTRTYEDGKVIITMAKTYSGAISTVDWGDGRTSTGSVSFSHDYGRTSSGTITVTTQFGISGQTVQSSVQYSVSGSEPLPVPVPEESEGVSAFVVFILATILLAAIALWRILS